MDQVQARSATPQMLSPGPTKLQFPHLYDGNDNSVFFIVSR